MQGDPSNKFAFLAISDVWKKGKETIPYISFDIRMNDLITIVDTFISRKKCLVIDALRILGRRNQIFEGSPRTSRYCLPDSLIVEPYGFHLC